jgi:hypothetical protein
MRIHENRAPHTLTCRCEDCTEWVHSHHEAAPEYGTEAFIDWNCRLCIPFPGEADAEVHIDTTECWECHTRQEFTGREKIIEAHRDPTAAYELACGHWVI